MNATTANSESIDIWDASSKDIVALAHAPRIDKFQFEADCLPSRMYRIEQSLLRGISGFWRTVKAPVKMTADAIARDRVADVVVEAAGTDVRRNFQGLRQVLAFSSQRY